MINLCSMLYLRIEIYSKRIKLIIDVTGHGNAITLRKFSMILSKCPLKSKLLRTKKNMTKA